jgi:hypothetical protein
VLNIAMVSTSNVNSSGIGEIWLGLADSQTYSPSVFPILLQYTKPVQLKPGSSRVGLVEIAERRTIAPSFLDMIGLTPVRDVLVLSSVS